MLVLIQVKACWLSKPHFPGGDGLVIYLILQMLKQGLKMEGYKFIAGAICPSCKEQDRIVLKDDDYEVKCISCNYFERRNDKDLGSIKIIDD